MNINDLNYLINCLANILDIVSYISSDILLLRIVLVGASALFIWSAIIVPDAESIFFNIIYLLINFFQICYLLWMMRPIEFENEDIETVYNRVFAPPLTAMSKLDFQILVENSFLRKIEKGQSYCEDGNMVDNLSILISGKIECVRFEVDKYGKRKERVVNTIGEFEFIESPQWLTRRTDFDQTFVGRMRAGEDCHYLTWKLEELDVLIATYPQYKSYVDAVVGSDVARKILKMDANIEELTDEPVHHVHEPPSSSDPFKINPAITAAYNREYGIEQPEQPQMTVDQGMNQNRSLIFGGSMHRRHQHKAPSRQPSFNASTDHHHVHNSHGTPGAGHHHTASGHHHEEQHVHVSLGRSVHLRRTIGDILSGSVHNRTRSTTHSHPPPAVSSVASHSADGHISRHNSPHVSRVGSSNELEMMNVQQSHTVQSPLRAALLGIAGYQSIPTRDSPTTTNSHSNSHNNNTTNHSNDNNGDTSAVNTSHHHMELTTGDTDGGITEPSDHHMYVVNEDAENTGSEDY